MWAPGGWGCRGLSPVPRLEAGRVRAAAVHEKSVEEMSERMNGVDIRHEAERRLRSSRAMTLRTVTPPSASGVFDSAPRERPGRRCHTIRAGKTNMALPRFSAADRRCGQPSASIRMPLLAVIGARSDQGRRRRVTRTNIRTLNSAVESVTTAQWPSRPGDAVGLKDEAVPATKNSFSCSSRARGPRPASRQMLVHDRRR
jgi:hypothetical protein